MAKTDWMWPARAIVFTAALMTSMAAGTTMAHAQSANPNSGAITFTGGIDAPSVYVFRGIVQESHPKMTLWPYGDLGLALGSGEGAIKSVGVNVGVWNSVHTGTSGSDGSTRHAHYEEDFYATLGFGLAKCVTAGATYTAYTSPNLMFNTVKEISFKVAQASRFNPYGLIGFELGKNGADGGTGKGTYLELGGAPSFPLGARASLAVPVKLGLSLNDYYELDGVDHRFGFFDIGGVVTVPLTFVPSRLGAWNVHGGVDLLVFGDTTQALNSGDSNKVVGLFGIGLTY